MTQQFAEIDRLTARQLQCLDLAGRHWTSKEIGRQLQIAPKTVDRHIDEAVRRLGVADRAGAVALLLRARDVPLKTNAFISYAKADAQTANRVRSLMGAAGYVFDDQALRSFQDATDRIINGFRRLGDSDRVFVALLSPDFVASYHCREEWSAATSPACVGQIRIVPLLIRPTKTTMLGGLICYDTIAGLEGLEFDRAVIDAVTKIDDTSIALDIASPTPLGWTSESTIAVLNNSSLSARLEGRQTDYGKQVAAVCALAERLTFFATSPQFNGSREYGTQLALYADEVPRLDGSGNIFICDAVARTITEMFRVEVDILPVGFSAQLRALLECHIAMRAFFPEVADFYEAVRTGALSDALPLDAVENVRSIVEEFTPVQFDPSVSSLLSKEAGLAPAILSTQSTEQPVEMHIITPPKDPLGEVNRSRARDDLLARSLNGLWKVFMAGEAFSKGLDSWRKAYEGLNPAIKPILAYLKRKFDID